MFVVFIGFTDFTDCPYQRAGLQKVGDVFAAVQLVHCTIRWRNSSCTPPNVLTFCLLAVFFGKEARCWVNVCADCEWQHAFSQCMA